MGNVTSLCGSCNGTGSGALHVCVRQRRAREGARVRAMMCSAVCAAMRLEREPGSEKPSPASDPATPRVCIRTRAEWAACLHPPATDVDRSMLDAKMANMNLDPARWQATESSHRSSPHLSMPKVARAVKRAVHVPLRFRRRLRRCGLRARKAQP